MVLTIPFAGIVEVCSGLVRVSKPSHLFKPTLNTRLEPYRGTTNTIQGIVDQLSSYFEKGSVKAPEPGKAHTFGSFFESRRIMKKRVSVSDVRESPKCWYFFF